MKVWRSQQGMLFHDDCFEAGESRDDYTLVSPSDLEADDECESCGGFFFDVEDDDIDDSDDDSEPTETDKEED